MCIIIRKMIKQGVELQISQNIKSNFDTSLLTIVNILYTAICTPFVSARVCMILI